MHVYSMYNCYQSEFICKSRVSLYSMEWRLNYGNKSLHNCETSWGVEDLEVESDQGRVLRLLRALAWAEKPELPHQALALGELMPRPLRSYWF